MRRGALNWSAVGLGLLVGFFALARFGMSWPHSTTTYQVGCSVGSHTLEVRFSGRCSLPVPLSRYGTASERESFS
jgi:hypothetical protein